jgi:microcystin-dependent protein
LNLLLNLNNKNYNIMKKVILTLTALFFTLLSFSQGIAVQGIARDANNTARVNTLLTLQFQVYYRDGATEVSIYNRSSNVTTDFFGVFSHVIEIEDDAGTVTEFGNQELWLRISEGSTAISEAKFNRVPYAYAASNGVPTGSIMPFIGTTAPSGWLLCDGGTIEAVRHTAALRNLLGGTTTPDLRGMFLRGTGTSSLSETNAVKEGPTLMSTQQDSNKSHKHTKGDLVTGIEGDHNHHKTVDEGKTSEKIYDRITRVGTGDNVAATSRGPYAGLLDLINSQVMPDAGDHTHPILGSVASSGGIESRPVNYGVNYIIKL